MSLESQCWGCNRPFGSGAHSRAPQQSRSTIHREHGIDRQLCWECADLLTKHLNNESTRFAETNVGGEGA